MTDLSQASVAQLIEHLRAGTQLTVDFTKGDATLDIVGMAGTYPSLAKIAAAATSKLEMLNAVKYTNAGTDNHYFGMAVYEANEVGADLANAASNTKKTVLGLVTNDLVLSQGGQGIALSTGTLTGTIQQWELATGMVGGLLARTDYFLDVVNGQITPFPPSGTGQWLCPVGRALSNTTFLVRIEKTTAI